LSGIAAILRFPLPDLDENDNDDDSDDDDLNYEDKKASQIADLTDIE